MTKETENLYKLIEASFPGLPLKLNVPWVEVTTFGVGTVIPILAEPSDDIALVHLLKFCDKHNIPLSVLGGGSNMLGADNCSECVVVRLAQNDFVRVRPSRKHVTAGAGVRLYDLIVTSAHRGLGGAAPLAAIPGTVGGAVVMNAGAYGTAVCDWMDEVCGFTYKGEYWIAQKDELEIGYRYCSIPDDVIVTAAIFKFEPTDAEEELERISSQLEVRRKKNPVGRSAGCIFRNPSPDVTAGKLIDQSGCKKMECGNLHVSDVHANYILNSGGQASEADFVTLAKRVRESVFGETGILLAPEIKMFCKETQLAIESALPGVDVVVLKGGASAEREVSLESGAAVAKALRSAGHKVTECDISSLDLPDAVNHADVVFPVLHGGFGEDGKMQKLLEDRGIFFVGCDSEASYVAMDKVKSKELMLKNNVQTPDFAVVADADAGLPENLQLPVVVKPPLEGSTFGITIVEDIAQWKPALVEALKYGEQVLVEAYVKGRELTVGVVDGNALPVIEIRYPGQMYDYDAKYTHEQGETEYLCPSESIPENVQKKARKIAEAFYKGINARDMLRVDFILSEDEELYVLEGNSIPGFTASSLLPKAAKVAGIPFVQLCAKLVKLAYDRKNSFFAEK